jgi:stage III sporulation protein SpoIIIAA
LKFFSNRNQAPVVTDEADLAKFLQCLPKRIREDLEGQPDLDTLLEVVLDFGRLPEARFAKRAMYLGDQEVTQIQLRFVLDRVGEFNSDNRAGIERTLHRISCLRNRKGQVIGVTCRAGRAVFGAARVIEDLLWSGRNILLVGRPGVGKTTMLRESARVLADEAKKRVVIVDTSNEIAGDADIPHSAIGRARRMQVSSPVMQHATMIEAVENHMPETIIIDEMGTEEESKASRTIAERGVQLVATAHGNTLDNLLANPTLSDLLGGIQTVTLGDEEARRRRTQKVILERKAPPTFDTLIEIQDWYRVGVHLNVAETVDRILRGQWITVEERWLDEFGEIHQLRKSRAPGTDHLTKHEGVNTTNLSTNRSSVVDGPEPERFLSQGDVLVAPKRIFSLGVNRDSIIRVAKELGIPMELQHSINQAELILTTKAHFRNGSASVRKAEQQGKMVFVLRRNTLMQIRSFFGQTYQLQEHKDLYEDGMDTKIAEGAKEAQLGVARILAGEASRVQLKPQGAYVRRLQHQIIEQAMLRSKSVGNDPLRGVTIRGG